MRTEATSIAVISNMGSERKPRTTGRQYWTTLGKSGTGSWGEEGIRQTLGGSWRGSEAIDKGGRMI